MKKILFIVLIATSFTANSQWVLQNSGTAVKLTSVFFPTINNGYILQDDGYVRKTINASSSWNSASSFNDLSGQIYFTNATTGYATGMGIKKTTNGGLTWINTLPDSTYTFSVHFPTSNVGYATGTNINDDSVVVYKTVNGGTSWSRLSTISSQFSYFSYIYFINPSTGFVLDFNGGLFKTTNGGATWTNKLSTFGLYSVHFPSPSIGYASGFDSIFKSTDGGETWFNLNVSQPTEFHSIYFISDNVGYTCGGDGFGGKIEKTIDGGASWSLELSTVQVFYSMSFPNASTGYVCGDDGVIYKLNTSIGIDEVSQNNNINIYPNPTNGVFTIDTKGTKIKEIRVMNMMGEIIRSEELGIRNEIQMDMSAYANGIYYVRTINEEGEMQVKKLIKE